MSRHLKTLHFAQTVKTINVLRDEAFTNLALILDVNPANTRELVEKLSKDVTVEQSSAVYKLYYKGQLYFKQYEPRLNAELEVDIPYEYNKLECM